MKTTLLCVLIAALGAACLQRADRAPPASDTSAVPNSTATPAAPAPAAAPTLPPSPGATKVTVVEGFLTPESVLHDTAQDIYFVSNINGSPTAKDDNGFISRVRPDGAVENLKFIEGGHNGVTLHAPKGLALLGDTLWVADIDVVRAFDARTGTARDSVSLATLGAVLLNDIAIAQTGALYITDTASSSTTSATCCIRGRTGCSASAPIARSRWRCGGTPWAGRTASRSTLWASGS